MANILIENNISAKEEADMFAEMILDLIPFSMGTYINNKDSKDLDKGTFNKQLEDLEEKYRKKYNISFTLFAQDIAKNPEGQRLILDILKEISK